jgi:hypothetical protein
MPSLQAWKSGSDIIKDPRRQSLSRPYCTVCTLPLPELCS